jgi:hypothetical protein
MDDGKAQRVMFAKMHLKSLPPHDPRLKALQHHRREIVNDAQRKVQAMRTHKEQVVALLESARRTGVHVREAEHQFVKFTEEYVATVERLSMAKGLYIESLEHELGIKDEAQG